MRRKAYLREEVVGAAMDVFWTRGFHGTSIQDLCDATGLNRKSLYAEFGDKRGIFDEALTSYTLAGLSQAEAALGREPLGLDNIRRYFSSMSYGPACRGCLMTMTINERALVAERAVERVGATIAAIETLLRSNLLAAGLSRERSESLANFLIYSIQGITTMGKLYGDDQRLKDAVGHILTVLDVGGG